MRRWCSLLAALLFLQPGSAAGGGCITAGRPVRLVRGSDPPSEERVRWFTLEDLDTVSAIAFSPLGQLAVADANRILVVNAESRLVDDCVDLPGAVGVQFSSHGRLLHAITRGRSYVNYSIADRAVVSERKLPLFSTEDGAAVRSFAVDDTGEYIFTGHTNSNLNMWSWSGPDGDVQQTSLVGEGFAVHSGHIECIKVFGVNLVSTDTSGGVVVWDYRGRSSMNRFSHEGRRAATSVSPFPDGYMVASIDILGELNVWKSFTGQGLLTEQCGSSEIGIRQVAVSPDAKHVSCAADGVVDLFRIASANTRLEYEKSFAALKSLHTTPPPLVGLTYSNDGVYLAGAGGSAAAVWRMGTPSTATGATPQPPPPATLPEVPPVTACPDIPHCRYRLAYPIPITASAVSSDGVYLGVGTGPGQPARVHGASNGYVASRLPDTNGLSVSAIATHSSDYGIATAVVKVAVGAQDRTVLLTMSDADKGPRVLWQITAHSPVTVFAFSPDADLLAAADGDAGLTVRSTDSGETVANITTTGSVTSMAFRDPTPGSAPSPTLAATLDTGHVVLLRGDSLAPAEPSEGFPAQAVSAPLPYAVSPDALWVLDAGGARVVGSEGSRGLQVDGAAISSAAFAPHTNRVAVAADGVVSLYSAVSGQVELRNVTSDVSPGDSLRYFHFTDLGKALERQVAPDMSVHDTAAVAVVGTSSILTVEVPLGDIPADWTTELSDGSFSETTTYAVLGVLALMCCFVLVVLGMRAARRGPFVEGYGLNDAGQEETQVMQGAQEMDDVDSGMEELLGETRRSESRATIVPIAASSAAPESPRDANSSLRLGSTSMTASASASGAVTTASASASAAASASASASVNTGTICSRTVGSTRTSGAASSRGGTLHTHGRDATAGPAVPPKRQVVVAEGMDEVVEVVVSLPALQQNPGSVEAGGGVEGAEDEQVVEVVVEGPPAGVVGEVEEEKEEDKQSQSTGGSTPDEEEREQKRLRKLEHSGGRAHTAP